MWQGAKETAKFCRFWRFLASATRDYREGIIAVILCFSSAHITSFLSQLVGSWYGSCRR
jgi:hypothetical protein